MENRLGAVIRQERQRLKLTQEEFACAVTDTGIAHITQSYINKLERGRAAGNVGADLLLALATVLGWTTDRLMTEAGLGSTPPGVVLVEQIAAGLQELRLYGLPQSVQHDLEERSRALSAYAPQEAEAFLREVRRMVEVARAYAEEEAVAQQGRGRSNPEREGQVQPHQPRQHHPPGVGYLHEPAAPYDAGPGPLTPRPLGGC